MTRLRLLILLACLAGVLLLAIGPAGAVTGGEPDTDHPYVGLVAGPSGLCSGSLVSSTVFVTAAHCFGSDLESVKVRFGEKVSPATRFVTGTAHVHPGFSPGGGLPFTNDVAVVVLDKGVKMKQYGRLPSLGLADTLGERFTVTVVGYGVSVFLGPTAFSDFTRRTADVEVVTRNGAGSDTHLRLSPKDADACFGDSGGPVLQHGTHTILAVNSFTTNGRCQGGYAYRLDIAAAQSFLSQFAG